MKTVAKGAEAKLLEIVSSLRAAPDGYYALHYNLSQLQDEFRSEYQIKIAVNILNDLFKALDSIAFVLADSDIVLLYNGANRALLEKAIFQLRYLFMDDPLGYTDDGFENEDFCTVYDLEFQWRDFFAACQRKAGKEPFEKEETAPTTKIETPTGNRDKLHIFTPNYLVQILSEMQHIDISPALRSQPICALVKDKAPKVLFKEVYTNIKHLQKSFSLNVDLMSSRTLFKYLSEAIDKQVLRTVKDKASLHTTPISLNLNIKNLFSEEFADFDSVIEPSHKASVIIEIHVADVFEDIPRFLMAQEEIQKMGYRICLDGLDEISFSQINRKSLGFDLAKLKWTPEMAANSNKSENLAEVVKTCGANRVILCRCDNQTAIDYGKSIGISLFQGRHIDGMVNPGAAVEN
jgi:EAL domain-containing protein (putative c-di-GMP-specific phosphodiesterase class I)